MIRKRSARALAGGLAVIVLLVAASVAYAAVTGTFSGQTGQKQPISFRVAHGYVTNLQFTIRERCPNGDIWKATDHGFPKIKINKFHKFDEPFSNKVLKARAEIKGTVFKQKVTGSIFEGRVIAKEHKFCSATVKFTAHKR